jgi:hypothetical protein|tara:strand:+ start:1441 stop:1689 length:249 start_codon:yes stop_codon:yes gene_type:complete
MKIIGAEEALATGTTKGKTVTAHYVFNTGSVGAVTIRNADDDGDTGSVRVGANAGVVIHTDIGVGMRGASDIKITPIVASGF